MSDIYGYDHSRPIKISENLAARFMTPTAEGCQQRTPSATRTILPDLPEAQEQHFRNDGVYVDEGLFREIQKQAVVHEVHTRELKEELQQQFQPFKEKQHLLTNLETPPQLANLHRCLVEYEAMPLKCNQLTMEFTKFVDQITRKK